MGSGDKDQTTSAGAVSSAQRKDRFVVAIGASAGGLESLQKFFHAVPTDTGHVYVVIQHLSPDYKSLMPELIQKVTTMKVSLVVGQAQMLPNHIYVIAPRQELKIKFGRLISSPAPDRPLQHLIDSFFDSVGSEFRDRAIAVVLSGTGSDGTRGAGVVKEYDGFVLVEDPDSAKFTGMPLNLIQSKAYDKVCIPEKMPTEIANYVLFRERNEISKFLTKNKEEFLKILHLLQSVDGIDFSSYRPSTIVRRLQTRMSLSRIDNFRDYLQVIVDNEDELATLHSELLIGVTRFFRDHESFSFLRNEIIPQIVASADPEEGIRVWTAGCSTGEETYTITMLFLEAIHKANRLLDLKVFATDVDRDALAVATEGVYPIGVLTEIPSELLGTYFIRSEDRLTISKVVRKHVVFSFHNLVKDPPFSKMDLVCCRNVLIYFQTGLQQTALSFLQFALKSGGVLFLGNSEALGDIGSDFEAINSARKVFRKTRGRPVTYVPPKRAVPSITQHRSSLPMMNQPLALSDTQLIKIYESLFKRLLQPCFLIDSHLEILHTFGAIPDFVMFTSGKPSLNLAALLPMQLRMALSSAVDQALATKSEVQISDVGFQFRDQPGVLDLKVIWIQASHYQATQYLVVMFDIPEEQATPDKHKFQLEDSARERIAMLEHHLQVKSEELQTTIEELQTTNEELQSTNEELMSSNEELQSSNEELHSTNEELQSLAFEYQEKSKYLHEAKSDVEMLLRKSTIGIMIFDKNLRLKTYNDEILPLVKLEDSNLGLACDQIRFKMMADDLSGIIKDVFNSGRPHSRELMGTGSTFLLTVSRYSLPAEGGESSLAGVFITLIDVSSIKEAEELRSLTSDLEKIIYFASHDLRKPIRYIQETVGQLSPTRSPTQGDITSLTAHLHKLQQMMDDLLKFSRLKTRAAKFMSCDANIIIANVMDELNLDASQITVIMRDLPTIIADHSQFEEIFRELFRNTIRHAGSSAGLEIFIQCRTLPNHWEFRFEDNGQGRVTREIAQKAFEMFKKPVEAATTGSGLAFCKRIVERHAGKIWLDEGFSQGWRVYFTIRREQS